MVFFMLFLIYILVPSIQSYDYSCVPNYESQTYHVAGSYDSASGKIEISMQEKEKTFRTLRHEYTHYLQAKQNRSYPCTKPVLFVFNEIEAYLNEYFIIHELPQDIIDKVETAYNSNITVEPNI